LPKKEGNVREIKQEPEECPEAKHYEAYAWCNLSDNICIRNTGNEKFDVACEYCDDLLKE